MKNETLTSGISILDVEHLEKNMLCKKEKSRLQIGQVLRCRLDGLTLEASGKVVGRTRERIRQMEAVGCAWIRHHRK